MFRIDNVTGTTGPQILTCPAGGPNVLRKANYATFSLSTQGGTVNNTTSQRVTTIILMLILINKNVNNILVPMQNVISFVISIVIDVKRGDRIFF